MPLTQLMRKLSKRESTSTRTSDSRGTAQGSDMDYDRTPCYDAMAAIVPQHDHRRSPCISSLSTSSSSSATFDEAAISAPNQQYGSHTSPSQAQQMMVGSLPSTSAAAASQPVNARVLRSKGKAALRGQTLSIDEPLNSSFRASMSIAQQAAFPQELSTAGPAGSYHRSATDPVSLWVATGSVSNSTSDRLRNCSLSLPRAAVSGPSAAVVVPVHEEEDDEEPLASPVSPAAASNAHLCEEGEHHCDWEDGVVGGWLAGIDPSELMHHDDHLEDAVQQHKSVAAVAMGTTAPERTGSSMSTAMSSDAVYGSVLYS